MEKIKSVQLDDMKGRAEGSLLFELKELDEISVQSVDGQESAATYQSGGVLSLICC